MYYIPKLQCIFRHLGSYCSHDLSMKVEIYHKLSSAAFAFQKLERLYVWNDPFMHMSPVTGVLLLQKTLLSISCINVDRLLD